MSGPIACGVEVGARRGTYAGGLVYAKDMRGNSRVVIKEVVPSLRTREIEEIPYRDPCVLQNGRLGVKPPEMGNQVQYMIWHSGEYLPSRLGNRQGRHVNSRCVHSTLGEQIHVVSLFTIERSQQCHSQRDSPCHIPGQGLYHVEESLGCLAFRQSPASVSARDVVQRCPMVLCWSPCIVLIRDAGWKQVKTCHREFHAGKVSAKVSLFA